MNCLIDLCAMVGIPQELLTDNGTNFISKVVKQFYQTTGVHQIRTYPYHPETDGMVESFNSTLKRLLRKLTQNTKVEWDKMFTFCAVGILWDDACHNCFLPLPTPIGREMRTPLDELVRFWKGKEIQIEVDVTEYIRVMKGNMEVVRDIAQQNRERKEKSETLPR